MELIVKLNGETNICEDSHAEMDVGIMNLSTAEIGREYLIKKIDTNDSELEAFLFTLGCYEGQKVTVVSKISGNFVISVKDARYSIDKELAESVSI